MDYNLIDIDGAEIGRTLYISEFGEIDRFYEDGIMPPDFNEEGEALPVTYKLYVHSLIYDENFQRTSITKTRNTRIIITVYRAAIMDCSMLVDSWVNGFYAFIDPSRMQKGEGKSYSNAQSGTVQYSNRRMVYISAVSGRCRTENDYPMYPTIVTKHGEDCGYGNLLNYGANNGFGVDSRFYIHTNSDAGYYTYGWYSERDRLMRNYISLPEKVLSTNYKVHGLTIVTAMSVLNSDKHKSQECEFVIFKNQLDEPEEMTLNFAYTDDFLHPRFNNIFNMRHLFVKNEDGNHICWDKTLLPVNDFHITSVSRYNSLTDSYDAESFTDDPTYDFRNPERGIWGVMTIIGFNDDKPFDVGININTHIPVIGFNDTSDYTIYMTDTYWDPSTFVQLQDNSTVPAALQNKKYFIKTPATTGANAGGFHTIRQPNNHTLVPSSNITELNTANIMPWSNTNLYYNSYYASDDGWAYCNGVLIFPDSDDGAGHIYRHTMNIDVSSYGHSNLFFTHNRIVFMDGHYRMDPSDTTTPKLIVYYIDPTHPEINPENTAITYYPSDIMFEDSSTNDYLEDYVLINIEPKKNKLFLSRNTQVKYIDLNDYTKRITLMPFEVSMGLINFIYDSNYVVCYNGIFGDKYKFTVYNITNSSVHSTFYMSLMNNSNIIHLVGYSTRVYVQFIVDSKYFLIEYDIVSGISVAHEDVVFNLLMTRCYGYDKFSYLNHKMPHIDYDDECFVMHSFANLSYQYYNLGGRTIVIFKNDLDNPYFFDNTKITTAAYHVSKSFVTGYQTGYPRLKKFNNGKDYILMITCKLYENDISKSATSSSYTQTYCFDLGYIRNKGLHTPEQMCNELPMPIYKMPNVNNYLEGAQASSSIDSPYYYDSKNKWFANAIPYKDKILVFTTFGPPMFVPVEMFLPHKITGTTTSVQTYNQAKKVSKQSFSTVLKALT